MAFNPADTKSQLNNPTQRANELNDPQFENQQGYFPYDLTHQEFITPRFGEATPSMHVHTVPADRVVCHDDIKTVLNTVNGNLLSQLNQYVDTFYVPMRSYFPHNVDKLIPNPTKGDDLPNSALPQFPLQLFIRSYLKSSLQYTINGSSSVSATISEIYDVPASNEFFTVALSRMLLLCTVFSRGQLLDYLGCCLDNNFISKTSAFQEVIDNFFETVYSSLIPASGGFTVGGFNLELSSNTFNNTSSYRRHIYNVTDLSSFRDMLSDAFERGELLSFSFDGLSEDKQSALSSAVKSVRDFFVQYFSTSLPTLTTYISTVDSSDNPFNIGYINLEKLIAYQQVISQYYTNNSVDNIFNSELFMQNLGAVMFPATSTSIYSRRPTFEFNGVDTEYDLISCGATYSSLISTDLSGQPNRQYVWLTIMMLMRRTLRYGDYFSTARPEQLAVGQLSINVEDGKVSPIDVTQNLLKQRYLNAANYVGSGVLQYYASFFDVIPSDTGTFPRFISHRKIVLQNDVTTNTASNQGAQTTNLIGVSDKNGVDVFIDDFGVIISVISYDVLPVYKSGIDPTYHFADRFDYFNSMLQGIGDQQIRVSEFVGSPALRQFGFGWTMRNGEYKYKISRAHGAFVNRLPGWLISYPLFAYSQNGESTVIDPDFIRDKPVYLDSLVPQMTGISPANYYHFVVSVTNELHMARKMQATPPVLF